MNKIQDPVSGIVHVLHCTSCKGNSFLYRYSKNGNKQYYMCRKCNTQRSIQYRKTEVGKLNTRKAVYKSLKKFKYKQDARIKVRTAIQNGEIVKPNKCKSCKKDLRLSAHHTDYSIPLKVIWLCRGCHADIHRKEKLKA